MSEDADKPWYMKPITLYVPTKWTSAMELAILHGENDSKFYPERHYWPNTEEGRLEQEDCINELWIIYYKVEAERLWRDVSS